MPTYVDTGIKLNKCGFEDVWIEIADERYSLTWDSEYGKSKYIIFSNAIKVLLWFANKVFVLLIFVYGPVPNVLKNVPDSSTTNKSTSPLKQFRRFLQQSNSRC